MKFFTAASTLLYASAALAATTNPSRTVPEERSLPEAKRWKDSGFVGSSNGQFTLNGKPFYFLGTNAYWLTQLNAPEDINATLTEIASRGYKVVRSWAFRHVIDTPDPDPAKYTHLWKGNVQTINQAGIDRIAYILDVAESLGLKMHFSLTNNFAPEFPSNFDRPAGYYGNSYGGIDTYVRQILGADGHHDSFYTDETLKNSYKDFLSKIVPQFVNHGALMGWELANDPRCKGATGSTTSGTCNAQTITRWTAELSQFIKQLDPNHLVASGDSGFFCVDCPKLYPIQPKPNPSGGSSGNGVGLVGTKRSRRRNGYLTKADVINQRRETERELYRLARAEGLKKRGVRGKWAAPETSFTRWRRQDTSTGGAFDGSQGVDSEDISNIPTVDYQSFQLLPDQNDYSSSGSDSSGPPDGGAGGGDSSVAIQQGIDWITHHAESSQLVGKPSHLTAFGLVDQDNSNSFLAQDSTHVGIDSATSVSTARRKRSLGPTPSKTENDARVAAELEKRKATHVASEKDQQTAYSTWTSDAIKKGVNGITHYQYRKKGGLHSKANSAVDNSNHSHQSGSDSSNNNSSPNDGYASTSAAIQSILSGAAHKQNSKSGQDSS